MASQACVILAERHGLCVTITNGEKLPSSGCCRNMAISVHGENFHINCFGLPLGSYDMVLGVQWLESLGPILWDFCRGMATGSPGQWRRRALHQPRPHRYSPWTSSWRSSLPCSRSPPAYHWPIARHTASTCYPTRHQSRCTRTAMHMLRRWSSNGNAPPCSTAWSSGLARRLSPLRYCLSINLMTRGDFVLITGP
jgi:hypothetical protein